MFILYGYANSNGSVSVDINSEGLEALKSILVDKIKEYASNNEMDKLCDAVKDYTKINNLLLEASGKADSDNQ